MRQTIAPYLYIVQICGKKHSEQFYNKEALLVQTEVANRLRKRSFRNILESKLIWVLWLFDTMQFSYVSSDDAEAIYFYRRRGQVIYGIKIADIPKLRKLSFAQMQRKLCRKRNKSG